MLKANELRRDNYLFQKSRGIYLEIDNPDGLRYIKAWGVNYPINDFDPIPLTREWLGKLGFENEGNNVFTKGHLRIGVDDRGGANWVFYFNKHLSLCQMSYVHQLQNLYFALTGEELTIKQSV